jgi:hypothetical protein
MANYDLVATLTKVATFQSKNRLNFVSKNLKYEKDN